MFRKPKNKATDTVNRSIRKRLEEGNDATSSPIIHDNDNKEPIQRSENLPIQKQSEIDRTKHTGLSFDQQEGFFRIIMINF